MNAEPATEPAAVCVFRTDAHLGHDGLIELVAGREVPCWESPRRAMEIERALRAHGGFRVLEPRAFGRGPILAIHDSELLDAVDRAWTDAVAAGHDPSRAYIPDTFRLDGYAGPMSPLPLPDAAHLRLGAFCFDTATPVVAGTAAAAYASVDVALSAAAAVAGGDGPLAYGLCRPPGHHAARRMLGGYCYFNNAAIVAEWLRREAGARRVAIVDVDYHHGNGTQQIFWERADVLYVSLHGDPARAYPYFSGSTAERGGGAGTGFTHNVPLPARTTGDAYATALARALDRVAAFDPDAPLVVSLGFDTFERDPISDLALTTDDYTGVGRLIGRTAAAGGARSVVALQEGGYALDAIGANAVAFLTGLQEGLR
ncbi:MAG TPA: histone deacetylase family protein [candidate division Zixibacteria bacterium]|nr:histone deacetylase family protein [candidate division Zixibacteria bacterium]